MSLYKDSTFNLIMDQSFRIDSILCHTVTLMSLWTGILVALEVASAMIFSLTVSTAPLLRLSAFYIQNFISYRDVFSKLNVRCVAVSHNTTVISWIQFWTPFAPGDLCTYAWWVKGSVAPPSWTYLRKKGKGGFTSWIAMLGVHRVNVELLVSKNCRTGSWWCIGP